MANKEILRYYLIPPPLQLLDDEGNPLVIPLVTDSNGFLTWWKFLFVFLLSDLGHFGKDPAGHDDYRTIKKAHRFVDHGKVVSHGKGGADRLERVWNNPSGTRNPEIMNQCEDAGWVTRILDPLREDPTAKKEPAPEATKTDETPEPTTPKATEESDPSHN